MSPKRPDPGPEMPGGVWLRERPAVRSGGLTRDRISRAAVAVLDRTGQSGLTLRALAESLDVHATSLYWHVASRDELLDLALDSVYAEIRSPARPGDDWEADLTGYMYDLRATLLRHPWSGSLASSRLLLGPAALERSEYVYASLARAGLTGTTLTAAAGAVSNLVIGSVAAETAWRGDGEPAARSAMARYLREHADRYPTLAAEVPEVVDRWDVHFDHAARFLLSGIRAAAGGP